MKIVGWTRSDKQLLLVAAISAVLASGCACGTRDRTLVVPPQAQSVAALLVAHPADPSRDITAILLNRSERSSRHLVYVRTRERPHIHASHDLVVTALRGTGTVWISGSPHRLRPGDVAVVDAGAVHYFVNEGSEPAAALVVFSPPYDGTDQVLVGAEN